MKLSTNESRASTFLDQWEWTRLLVCTATLEEEDEERKKILVLGTLRNSVLHSHWSRNVEARLSLVESFIVLLRQLSYAIKNQLGHPKPPTRGFGTQRPNGSLLAPRWFFMALGIVGFHAGWGRIHPFPSLLRRQSLKKKFLRIANRAEFFYF